MSDDPNADSWQPLADQPIIDSDSDAATGAGKNSVSAPHPWTPPAFGPPPAPDTRPPSDDQPLVPPAAPGPPAAPVPPGPPAYTQAPVYTQRPIYAQPPAYGAPPPGNPWATPGAAYPGAAAQSAGLDFVEASRPKRRALGILIGVIVTVVVLVVVGGIVLLGTHSSNSAHRASAAASASASAAPSQQPSGSAGSSPGGPPVLTAPSQAPAPAASSGPLDSYLLAPTDLGPNTLMVLIPSGRSVGDAATLDFCNYHYTSEALRTTRVQVEYVGGAQDASNEFVQYKPGGATSAYAEIRKAVSGCPSTFSDQNGQFSHIERTNIAGLTQEHLAITFEMAAPGLDGSLTTEWSTVVYQFDGNYFSGVYVYGTNKAQVQQLGSKLAVKAAHHLAEATAGKPGTGGGPFTSQAIPQDSGAQA